MNVDHALARLAWTRPLERREPAVGYASRLACLNGRPLDAFLREMAIRPHDLDRGVPQAVGAVAVLGGVAAQDLMRYTPALALDVRFRTVGGELLRGKHLGRTSLRYCPACVEADLLRFDGRPVTRPWLRLEWTIPHFRSCLEHRLPFRQVALVRRGSEPFDFSQTMAPLVRNGLEARGDELTVPSSPFQDWLLDRIEGRRNPANWLDDMPLYVAVSLCEAFGVSALHPAKVRTSTLTQTEWSRAADAGHSLLIAGAASITELLSHLHRVAKDTKGIQGPRRTFGYAYGLLQRTVGDPAYGKVRDAVRAFTMETMPLEPGCDVLGQVVAQRAVHSIQTASRASGINARSIRTLFLRRGLAEREGIDALSDHRVTVPAGSVATILDSWREAISTPEVAAITGIPKLHLSVLIARGHLPTQAGTEGVFNAKHRFLRQDVDNLMERMFAGAEVVDGETDRRVTVMRARQMAFASLENVLAMILAGSLSWKGRIGTDGNYGTLLLDADELTRRVRVEAPRSNYTKQEIPDVAPGIDRRYVDRLVAEGLLRIVEEFSVDTRRMLPVVSRESVDEFLSRIVTLGELTRTTGLHHKTVRMLLRRAGIETTIDQDRVGVFLYDRPSVAAAVERDPNFWGEGTKATLDAAL